MLANIDNVTIYLSILSVLFLAVLTFLYFQKENFQYKDERHFLFEGKTPLYSLASNVGALFSVTYFCGATFVYSILYKSWLLLLFAIVCLISAKLIESIISAVKKTLSENEFRSSNLNILLEFLRKKMTASSFEVLIYIFLFFYFALLIEELAVSRLVLNTLFPKNPEVTTLILSIICFVLICYLYVGGFKAVLKSDFLQMFIIVLFLLALSYFIFKSQLKSVPLSNIVNLFDFSVNIPIPKMTISLIFWLILGVSWFISSIDFYSRLNFKVQKKSLVRERIRFVRISLSLVFIMASFGIFFGQYLPEANISPTLYTKQTITLFFSEGSRIIILIFFSSIFCMMFTTIDTLFLTIMQVGSYQKRNIFSRKNLLSLLVVTVFFSCIIPSDAVSTMGVFIGSLSIILIFPIIKAVFFDNSKWFPNNISYLKWAFIISFLLFTICYVKFRALFNNSFEWHFILPSIVFVSIFSTFIAALVSERFCKKKGGEKNGVN